MFFSYYALNDLEVEMGPTPGVIALLFSELLLNKYESVKLSFVGIS